MSRERTAAFFAALTVVWSLAVVLAWFVGRNYEGKRIQRALNQATQRGRPPFSPGDEDPRGN